MVHVRLSDPTIDMRELDWTFLDNVVFMIENYKKALKQTTKHSKIDIDAASIYTVYCSMLMNAILYICMQNNKLHTSAWVVPKVRRQSQPYVFQWKLIAETYFMIYFNEYEISVWKMISIKTEILKL